MLSRSSQFYRAILSKIDTIERLQAVCTYFNYWGCDYY